MSRPFVSVVQAATFVILVLGPAPLFLKNTQNICDSIKIEFCFFILVKIYYIRITRCKRVILDQGQIERVRLGTGSGPWTGWKCSARYRLWTMDRLKEFGSLQVVDHGQDGIVRPGTGCGPWTD